MINEPFKPTRELLSQYVVPEWFRNAKFGMWAHLAPQCQPGNGDWYAHEMYNEGSADYNYHWSGSGKVFVCS